MVLQPEEDTFNHVELPTDIASYQKILTAHVRSPITSQPTSTDSVGNSTVITQAQYSFW